MPKKLKVGNYTVPVILRTEEDMDEMKKDGHFSQARMQIQVKDKFSDVRLAQDTILHESMHAAMYCYGIGAALGEDFTDELEEQLISGLAPAMLSVLRSNPKLVAYLME